uniref:COMM domain-containing protein n=1 Tax=Glossina brevipalpis TaxID=37001 RepID=A0A1A9WVV8_9MUSC
MKKKMSAYTYRSFSMCLFTLKCQSLMNKLIDYLATLLIQRERNGEKFFEVTPFLNKIMSFNWIKITDRAREGIKIINSLPYHTFSTVLQYVHRQMVNSQNAAVTGEEKSSNELENENALEALESLVGVPRLDFLLLIKTFSYILRRINTYIIKPSLLQAELREKLKLEDDAKIDAIVRLWVRQTTPIMNNLADERYESNEIADVAWKLNVEISSHCQQRKKSALGVLQLKTGAGEDITLEMNHEELLEMYHQFECIQNELDTMSTQEHF